MRVQVLPRHVNLQAVPLGYPRDLPRRDYRGPVAWAQLLRLGFHAARIQGCFGWWDLSHFAVGSDVDQASVD